jgi:ABC-2 type transport system permease protein
VAELDDPVDVANIAARTQLIAIAWLRWRVFANGFKRRQTGPRKVASIVTMVVLRILLWPIFAMTAIGPAVGAGFAAWAVVSGDHPARLAALLAVITLLWQFVAVNGTSMAAAISSFDPSSLLRFPLRFGRYLVLRLLLGFLTLSTIAGCLALVSCMIGIAVANPSLAPAAIVVLSVYAAMNIFLARMIGAWSERWLATRRAREVFGVLMAVFFIGVQYFNVQHFHTHHGAATTSWLLTFLQGANGFLKWLPPGFASGAILSGGVSAARIAQFAALLVWTAAFLAGFAIRLHKQFLGEYLSEGTPQSSASVTTVRAIQPTSISAVMPEEGEREGEFLSPTIKACLRKEWMYLRSNGAGLVGLLMPLIFVFIFSRGMLARHPSFLISGAVGYALLGPMGGLYNIFGAEGAGVQLYLLAPVHLRDVVLAKNIVAMAMLSVQAVLAWCLVWAVSTAPIPLSIQVASAFWIVFILFINLTLGTKRSIEAPRKVVIGQSRQLRGSSASRTSGLVILAVLLGSILLEVPVTLAARYWHLPWLGACVFLPLAVGSIAAYFMLLRKTEALFLDCRDRIAEELCGD